MTDNPIVKALHLAQGSLQRLDFHPIMNCFCAQPGEVYAYNGTTATIVNLNHDLHCAIRGDVLVALLEGSSPKLTLTQVGDQCHIRDGRSFIKLPTLSHEAFLFEPVEEDIECEFYAGSDFFEAFDMAIMNLMAESYSEEASGVTMAITAKQALIYSYDYASLLKSSITIRHRGKAASYDPIILPRAVADRARRIYQMLGSTDVQVLVTISESQIRFNYQDAGVLLIGNLVTDKTPIDFEANLKSYPIGTEKLQVPSGLKAALERCVVLLGEDLSATVLLTIGGTSMELQCSGHYGKADVELKMKLVETEKKVFATKDPRLAAAYVALQPTSRVAARRSGYDYGVSIKADQEALQLTNDTMRFVVGDASSATAKHDEAA